MAIRKFRKNLKPFIWIITVLFVMSSAVLYYGQVKNKDEGPKQYAFKLNGEEIPRLNIERIKASISSSYSQSTGTQVDPDIIETIAVDDEITKYLTLELADKMKIKVSNKEINDEYSNLKNSIGDDEQFKRLLSAQGFTRASLKKEIEENKKINKLLGSIEANIKVTDEELLKYYEENTYAKFKDKDFASSKEEIKKEYVQDKAIEQYSIELDRMRNSLKIENVQTEYQNALPKVEKEIEGFKFSNADIAKKVFMNMAQRRVDIEEAKKIVESQISNQMKLISVAIAKGVKVDETLPTDIKMTNYSKGLLNILRNEVEVNSKDIEKYFVENKDKYDKEATLDANIGIMSINPSAEDKKVAKDKAEELLKKVTKENFGEIAKDNSKDSGSAVNGGDLGWFSKELMVAPFAEASFKGKVGEIYPELVETDFGYHIIFVKEKKNENGKEEVNAAHILIVPEVSENTKKSLEEKALKLVEELNAKTITFEKLKEANKDIVYAEKINKISENGYLQGIGYDEKLAKHLFESKIGEYSSLETNDRVYIVEKISEEKALDAKLTDVSINKKVTNDYRTKKALEVVEKIVKDTK